MQPVQETKKRIRQKTRLKHKKQKKKVLWKPWQDWAYENLKTSSPLHRKQHHKKS